MSGWWVLMLLLLAGCEQVNLNSQIAPIANKYISLNISKIYSLEASTKTLNTTPYNFEAYYKVTPFVISLNGVDKSMTL